jgi:hypothetical protein
VKKQQSKGRRVSKFLAFTLMGLLFGAIFVRLVLNVIGPTTDQASPPSQTPATATTANPQAPQATQAPQPPVSAPTAVPNSSSKQAAIAVAAGDVNVLASAIFLPQPQANGIVQAYVASGSRQVIVDQIATAGPKVADTLGYVSLRTANQNAQYQVSTLEYRVDKFDGQTAIIRLFTVTSFVTADNMQYQAPSINIVTLKLVNDSWLYVSSEAPPVSDMPDVTGLTSSDAIAAFHAFDKQPLKGFVNYVSAS